MSKCLSSLHTYLQSRTQKIIDLLSYLQRLNLPFYSVVHTSIQNNIGILFQLLPKIQYRHNASIDSDCIIAMDEYAKHTISSDELRYIDYSIKMKTKRHDGFIPQPIVKTSDKPSLGRNGSVPIIPLPYHVLHSLPIVYPYDESKEYF